MDATAWLPVLVGLLLLTLGRRLYWVFVGAIGFSAGLAIATRLTRHEPDTITLLVALVCGVGGALLVLFLQRIAIVLAGLFAGGWLGALAWRALGNKPDDSAWIPILVGAALGAVLAATLFAGVLIVLSSLAGAALVTERLPLSPAVRGWSFVALAALGILVQANLARRRAD